MHLRDRVTSLIGLVLLVLGIAAIAFGAYPIADANSMLQRVWPILLFVVAMTIVADLSSKAGLFDVIARIVVQLAGKGPWALWLIISLVTVAFTVFLSLDTTVVLVTPLAVVLARRIGLSPVPYAITVVWLSNTGSLLLPISNLTNLLAAHAIAGGSPSAFASATWLVSIVCVVVPMAVIALVFRRSFRLPAQSPAGPGGSQVVITRGRSFSYGLQALRGRPQIAVAGLVVLAIVVALLAGAEVWIPPLIGAVLLVSYTAWTAPQTLSWSMIPLPMILLTSGLFLALGAAGTVFVNDLVAQISPGSDSLGALLTVSGVGALAANTINNLPAYLALEPVAHSIPTLVALLIGVNAGPLVTPWASLATLLWYERLVAAKANFGWRMYVLLGLAVAPLTVGAATVALWIQFS